MSLNRQLWLAVLIMMLFSFGGTFTLSMYSARHYLEQQLSVKNQDNVTSLALSISQLDKDLTSLELLIAAQFDSGHYQFIRLLDTSGNTLIERKNPPLTLSVPEWFTTLVPLHITPGTARIQDGWKQFGSLILESNSRFGYASLWKQTINLLIWFIIGMVVCGLAGTLILKAILHPLEEVIGQAEAIGERRFISVPEPATLDFQRVVRAMNKLTDRVKLMLEEEAARLEKLRIEAHFDPMTGMIGRQHFLNSFESLLEQADSSSGSLIIGRIAGMETMNRALGREMVDQMLIRVGTRLMELTEDHPNWLVGRIGGADFGLLTPGAKETMEIAQMMSAQLHLAVDGANLEGEQLIPVGGTQFQSGENLSTILSRADGALINAEQEEGTAVRVTSPGSETSSPTNLVAWRVALTIALDNNEISLAEFPVRDRNGGLLHHEVPVRLRLDEIWQPAGVFIPWAARLGLLPRLDAYVIDAALVALRERKTDIGVHVSAEALRDTLFCESIINNLRDDQETASRLWIEIPEAAAFRQLNEFRHICKALKELGCKIGLEHVGSHFSRINELHDLGLDFIKVDAALIRGGLENPPGQAFLRGLCMIGHAIGLLVIAEGVRHESESIKLVNLGFDGMTGPGIK
ncbi:MAG: EAL domain-containing protein [Proteobacteria bacterium]|nr:EAL domain-containing protein [Pseudomonadota bacterium]MBU1685899.1 EAL domain-containing protein [Pseudomonadota bacterium]